MPALGILEGVDMKVNLIIGRIPVGAVVLALFALGGCATTTHTADLNFPAHSYVTFNQELLGKTATVELGDGVRYKGRDVQVNALSTTWTDPRTGETRETPTAGVWRIVVTNHGKGGAIGLGSGLLMGGAIGLAAASGEDSLAAGAIPVVFGGLGALLGLIFGGASGVDTVYEINPALAPPSPPPAAAIADY
jgi:hypothetical protein